FPHARHHPAHRRRTCHPGTAVSQSAARRLQRAHRPGRAPGAGADPACPARPDPARLDAARPARHPPGPPAAQRYPHPRHPADHADRPQRRAGQGGRTGGRGRRLHHQAFLSARTAGAHQVPAAPARAATHTGSDRGRRTAAGAGFPARVGQRPDPAHGAHRIPPATLSHDPCRARVQPRPVAGPGLGRPRLRRRAHGRRPHPSPAQGLVSRWPGRRHPDRTRGGLLFQHHTFAMSKTLVSIALWALGGWLLGAWLGAATGWAVFALGLLLMVLISGLQLSRIARWVRAIDEPPPPSVGPWDEILAPIYRKLKQNRLDLQDRTRSFHRALLAAEALPDGALTLDAGKSLQWCNQAAAGHLGLDLDRDRGHSILNIVRAPEFARYASQDAWDRPLILHLGHGSQARTLSLHLAPYGVGQFLMVTRDITQIERLET